MAAAAQVAITDVTIQSVTAGSIIVAASVAFPGSYSTDAAGAFASQLTEDMSSILTGKAPGSRKLVFRHAGAAVSLGAYVVAEVSTACLLARWCEHDLCKLFSGCPALGTCVDPPQAAGCSHLRCAE